MKLHHRRNDGLSPKDSKHVVLCAEDLGAIEHYGDELWSIDTIHFEALPDWVVAYAAEYYGVDADQIYDELMPESIVDSAGAWDDEEFVRQLWADNEWRLISTIGYRTSDGGVVINPSRAPIERVQD
jgi:hypothetical protein